MENNFDLQDFENKIIEEIKKLEDYMDEKEKNLEYIFSNEFFKTLEEIKFLKKLLQKIWFYNEDREFINSINAISNDE